MHRRSFTMAPFVVTVLLFATQLSAQIPPVVKRPAPTIDRPPIATEKLQWDGTLAPEVTMPFGKNAQFTVRTKGGSGKVRISYTVSSHTSQFRDTPEAAGSSVSRTQQLTRAEGSTSNRDVTATVDAMKPAAPATMTVYYVGSPSPTIPSTPITLTVTARDGSGTTLTQTSTLKMTRAMGIPTIASITPVDRSNETAFEPYVGYYTLEVANQSWRPNDEGADVIAIYEDGLHYGIENLPSVGNATSNRFRIRFEDLNRGKRLKIYLRNMYGNSAPITVTLPAQPFETFPAHRLAPATANGRHYDLATHEERFSEGTDVFSLSKVSPRGRQATPSCGDVSLYYLGARTLDGGDDCCSARIIEQPKADTPFDPRQSVRVKWKTGVGSYSYQVHYAVKLVAGFCPARKRN